MLKKLSLVTVSAVSAFAMHSAEININNKDLELSAKMDVGQFNYNVEPSTMFIGAKYLNADEDNSDIDSGIEAYYELNFLMQQEINNSGLSIGMGVKTNHTENFTSIPLGLEASYELPKSTFVPIYIGASIYYAPEVLAMEDAKNFLEYRVSVDIEVIKNGRIVLGARVLDTNYEVNNVATDINYNKSAYMGFKFSF